MNENSLNGLCLTNQVPEYDEDDVVCGATSSPKVIISTCEKSKQNVKQRWMIKKAYNDFCFEVGSMVYILQFYPRFNKTKTPIYIDERINEDFNFNQFELYMRGFIEEQDVENNQFKIKLTYEAQGVKIINEPNRFSKLSLEAIATAIPPTPNPAAKAVISISNTVAKTVKTPNMTIITFKREEKNGTN